MVEEDHDYSSVMGERCDTKGEVASTTMCACDTILGYIIFFSCLMREKARLDVESVTALARVHELL